MWLFIILVAVPILEIALFIQVGGFIGLWPTLAIVVATALAGTALLRRQGFETLRRLQASLEQGRDPLGPIAHGAMILVAGVLLLTPGFFTDALGLSLLLPPVRGALIRYGAARLTLIATSRAARPQAGDPGRPPPGPRRPETLDGSYEVVDESPPQGHPSGWQRPPE
ncbi:hypothetical protein BH23PSE1_BH23PSE1_16670 [soil metagenome]